MSDFRYRELFGPDGRAAVNIEGDQLLVSPLILAPVEAYLENLARVSVFAEMPARIAFSVRRDQLWTDCAELEATGGKLNPDYIKFLSAAPEGYSEAFNRLWPVFEAAAKADPSKTPLAKLEIGIRYIEQIMATQHIAMENSIAALFSSLILEVWTAFEILAADLWVLAIDKGPKELANRIALSKQLQKPEDHITPETVHSLEFDARKEYGSFLREIGRVSFQKLDHIRLYYAEAFGKHIYQLFDQKCGGYIFAMAAFRNALIHNAGKADKHFIKQVQRFEEFREIKNEEKLPLDGVIVKKLTSAGAQLGIELIYLVDKVLTPTQTKVEK
jgi:hypothetical protein